MATQVTSQVRRPRSRPPLGPGDDQPDEGRQRCDGSRPSGKSSSKCGKSGMLPVNAFAQAANAALGIGSEPLMRA
jgi:hypothetical protein